MAARAARQRISGVLDHQPVEHFVVNANEVSIDDPRSHYILKVSGWAVNGRFANRLYVDCDHGGGVMVVQDVLDVAFAGISAQRYDSPVWEPCFGHEQSVTTTPTFVTEHCEFVGGSHG